MAALKNETIYADCIDCGESFRYKRKHHYHVRDRCTACCKAAFRQFEIGARKQPPNPYAMNYQEQCPCCGHRVTAYFHPLNKSMVHAFERMVEKYNELKRPINLEKDLSLTYSQNCNFQKMKHFGLVFFADKGWMPTQHGLKFYRGDAPVWSIAMSISNQTMPHSHKAWEGKKTKPRLIHIEDVVGVRYKHREEYAAEKSGQGQMFDT